MLLIAFSIFLSFFIETFDSCRIMCPTVISPGFIARKRVKFYEVVEFCIIVLIEIFNFEDLRDLVKLPVIHGRSKRRREKKSQAGHMLYRV